jgi:hypothetical protein
MFSDTLVANAQILYRCLGVVAAGLALVATSACSARANGRGLLTPPNPAAITPAPYQPERPFDVQADEVLSRPIYRMEQAVPFCAEIQDLLIPPGKATSLTHEGVVVVETRAGAGVATLQEKRTPLSTGSAGPARDNSIWFSDGAKQVMPNFQMEPTRAGSETRGLIWHVGRLLLNPMRR